MPVEKKRIFFIHPGPLMEVNTFLYTVLDQYFSGTICICTSSRIDLKKEKKILGFNLHGTKVELKKFSFNNVRFISNTILLAIKYRLTNYRIDLVTSYDPLKTGILGVICSKILKTNFAPSVNGVYTSPYVCLDEEGVSKKMKEILFPIIEGWVLKRSHAVKEIYKGQLDPFKKQLLGKHVSSFTNIVDVDLFLKEKPIDDTKEILFVGMPFHLKGVDILIKAFKKISDKNPEWTLKILGWFKDQDIVLQHIDNHPKILLCKPVKPSEMPEQMARCSFFVLPSRTEAMGRVLVEAMACGKARIGTNIDGIPTVIQDGIDGFLFELENADDLAEKMQILIDDEQLRKLMGENGKKRVQKDLSKEVYFEKLIDFYKKAIEV